MEFPAMPAALGRDELARLQLEHHRKFITRLYLENKKLQEIMRIMESQHHVRATTQQYKNRLRDWGVEKNIRTRDMRHLARLKLSRDRVNKPTRFKLHGKPVAISKVERFIKRQPKQGEELLAELTRTRDATPEYIVCETDTEDAECNPAADADTEDCLRALDTASHSFVTGDDGHGGNSPSTLAGVVSESPEPPDQGSAGGLNDEPCCSQGYTGQAVDPETMKRDIDLLDEHIQSLDYPDTSGSPDQKPHDDKASSNQRASSPLRLPSLGLSRDKMDKLLAFRLGFLFEFKRMRDALNSSSEDMFPTVTLDHFGAFRTAWSVHNNILLMDLCSMDHQEVWGFAMTTLRGLASLEAPESLSHIMAYLCFARALAGSVRNADGNFSDCRDAFSHELRLWLEVASSPWHLRDAAQQAWGVLPPLEPVSSSGAMLETPLMQLREIAAGLVGRANRLLGPGGRSDKGGDEVSRNQKAIRAENGGQDGFQKEPRDRRQHPNIAALEEATEGHPHISAAVVALVTGVIFALIIFFKNVLLHPHTASVFSGRGLTIGGLSSSSPPETTFMMSVPSAEVWNTLSADGMLMSRPGTPLAKWEPQVGEPSPVVASPVAELEAPEFD